MHGFISVLSSANFTMATVIILTPSSTECNKIRAFDVFNENERNLSAEIMLNVLIQFNPSIYWVLKLCYTICYYWLITCTMSHYVDLMHWSILHKIMICHESKTMVKLWTTITKKLSMCLKVFQEKDDQMSSSKCSVTKAAVKLKVPLSALSCCRFKWTTNPHFSMVPISQTASFCRAPLPVEEGSEGRLVSVTHNIHSWDAFHTYS